jgi:hypothetical protein
MLAGRKLVERRHRRVRRAKVMHVKDVVEVFLRAAETDPLVESAK